MMNTHRSLIAGALTLAASAPIYAQNVQVISQSNRFAWSENAGWVSFRNPSGSPVAYNVYRRNNVFAGFAWSENLGWINFGDGTPSNGVAYQNAAGTDFGVNITVFTGELSGFAWSENAGWINFFGGALATPSNPARVDTAARRLRGFAWGENIGWINLDDATRFVGIRCAADANDDGNITPSDIFDYLNAWFMLDLTADLTFDGALSPADIFEFLNSWFAGC